MQIEKKNAFLLEMMYTTIIYGHLYMGIFRRKQNERFKLHEQRD